MSANEQTTAASPSSHDHKNFMLLRGLSLTLLRPAPVGTTQTVPVNRLPVIKREIKSIKLNHKERREMKRAAESRRDINKGTDEKHGDRHRITPSGIKHWNPPPNAPKLKAATPSSDPVTMKQSTEIFSSKTSNEVHGRPKKKHSPENVKAKITPKTMYDLEPLNMAKHILNTATAKDKKAGARAKAKMNANASETDRLVQQKRKATTGVSRRQQSLSPSDLGKSSSDEGQKTKFPGSTSSSREIIRTKRLLIRLNDEEWAALDGFEADDESCSPRTKRPKMNSKNVFGF